MSDYRLLYCTACDKHIEKKIREDFDYTRDGDGPYCAVCWHFILRIQALSDRISDLEQNARADQRRHG
jgi:hypothetical protein